MAGDPAGPAVVHPLISTTYLDDPNVYVNPLVNPIKLLVLYPVILWKLEVI